MKRRTFIYLSVVSTASMSVPSLYCRNKDEALNKALVQPKLLSHICDTKTLREIGTGYKEQFPSENKEEQLINLLLTDSTGKPFSQKNNPPLIHSLLEQKIQQDFENDRTVVVKGWVLSATEARQCALFSLS